MSKFIKHGDKNVLCENYREIDILNDFFIIVKECRESFNYLKSIENLFNSQAWLNEGFDPAIINGYLKNITNLKSNYQAVENILSGDDVVEDLAISVTPETYKHTLDETQIIEALKQYIQLKSAMDKLQIQILNYMIPNLLRSNDKLSKKTELLSTINLHKNISYNMIMAFNHSAEEDRIVSYYLNCTNSEFKREYRKEKMELPLVFKIRDYTYMLSKKRKEFEHCYTSFIELLTLIPQFEQQEYLKVLTEKQSSYNKQVTLLTWLIAFFTIIMVGLAAVQFFKDSPPGSSPTVTESMYKQTEIK